MDHQSSIDQLNIRKYNACGPVLSANVTDLKRFNQIPQRDSVDSRLEDSTKGN
jgi:hypothetical protein